MEGYHPHGNERARPEPLIESTTESADLQNIWADIRKLASSKEYAQGKEQFLRELHAEIQSFAQEMISASLKEGFKIVPVGPPWTSLSRSGYLVRDEDPGKVIDALFNKTPLTIRAREEGNAAIASANGIASAFSWGHNGKGLRTIIGFERDAVHTTPITRSPDDLRSITDAVVVEGGLQPEEIKFVILRTPRQLFPEKFLSPEEADDTETQHIFRAIFPNAPDKKQQHLSEVL